MVPARVELENVTVARGDTRAARSVTFAVEPGERVFLLGPNGAGKTSLLLAVVGAVPFEGRVSIGGVPVERGTLARIRRETAFVFADPSDQFFLDDVDSEVRFGP